MALELAKKIISIESDKEHPDGVLEVLDVIKDYLQGFNFKEFEKDGVKSLLFYNTDALPKRFKVILNGHIDVVSAPKEQYEPKEKDGKMYARGAADMKSAVACQAEVFKKMANEVDYPLGLQIVSDEEIGGFKGTKHQIEEGIKADFVIAGEMTNFAIGNKAKGIFWVKITAKGKTAHGSTPWMGENAVWKMNEFLNTLRKEFPVPEGESWVTTANLAKISTSNTANNKVADDCSITLDIRYIPEDSEKIVKKIEEILPKEFEMDIIEMEPSAFTPEDNEYINAIQSAYKKVMGNETEFLAKHGGSDIRHFNASGCDGVVFGPIGYGIHTDDEWVDTQSLEDFQKILTKFLSSIQ